MRSSFVLVLCAVAMAVNTQTVRHSALARGSRLQHARIEALSKPEDIASQKTASALEVDIRVSTSDDNWRVQVKAGRVKDDTRSPIEYCPPRQRIDLQEAREETPKPSMSQEKHRPRLGSLRNGLTEAPDSVEVMSSNVLAASGQLSGVTLEETSWP